MEELQLRVSHGLVLMIMKMVPWTILNNSPMGRAALAELYAAAANWWG